MIIRKYPKIKNLGDKILKNLFDDNVEISEKIDGSQFRIYLDKNEIFEVGTKNTEGYELSKSRIELTKEHGKHDMFDIAIEQAERLKSELQNIINEYNLEGITTYVEYLRQKHHNGLNYNRIPKNHFYLFGTTYWTDDNIKNLETDYLLKLAKRLNIEPINLLYEGKIFFPKDLKKILEINSVLGGTKIEGIVIKNYNKTYPIDFVSTEKYLGFPLAGKLVRDEFKEVQKESWNKQKKVDSIEGIAETYLTEQRFLKSINHLRDENKLTFEKKDLAILIPEFLNDLLEEEEEHINKIVLNKFYEQFRRRLSSFVVHKYSDYLLEKQFEEE